MVSLVVEVRQCSEKSSKSLTSAFIVPVRPTIDKLGNQKVICFNIEDVLSEERNDGLKVKEIKDSQV